MEFLMLVGAATVMVFAFSFVFFEMYSDNLARKEEILLRDYGYSLQNEFIVASESRDGYVRTFEVPERLEGFYYNISITNSVLRLQGSKNGFSFLLPSMKGNIVKGSNILTISNTTLCSNC